MASQDFLAELKRRNVYRAAVAYVVVAWLLIQAGSILFPTFDAPAWMMKVFVVLLVLGFAPALMFAWAFEITPQGIRRESEVDPEPAGHASHGPQNRRAGAGGGGDRGRVFVFQSFRETAMTSSEPAAARRTDRAEEHRRPAFENLSSDKENAYFTDGVQDEILSHLARIADLKVIGRTSVMHYRSNAPRDLRKIGQQLGVAHLLEGSVQRAGNRVRVIAQLIDSRTDAHLWRRLTIATWLTFSRFKARSPRQSPSNCRPSFRQVRRVRSSARRRPTWWPSIFTVAPNTLCRWRRSMPTPSRKTCCRRSIF